MFGRGGCYLGAGWVEAEALEGGPFQRDQFTEWVRLSDGLGDTRLAFAETAFTRAELEAASKGSFLKS